MAEWQALNRKQKDTLICYVSNGYDWREAVAIGYRTTDAEKIRQYTFRIRKTLAVLMVLALHFGEDPEAAFLEQLKLDLLGRSFSRVRLEGYRIYAQRMKRNDALSRVLQQIEYEKNLKNNANRAEPYVPAKLKKDSKPYDLSGFEESK